MDKTVLVLREHFPKDIAIHISDIVWKMYLDEWKENIKSVNNEYSVHLEESYEADPFDMSWKSFASLCWSNFDGEDAESYDHDYSRRQFNYRDYERVIAMRDRNAFFPRPRVAPLPTVTDTLLYISHIPTQTSTGVTLPKNY